MSKSAALELVRGGKGKFPEVISRALAVEDARPTDVFDIVTNPIVPDQNVLDAVQTAIVQAASEVAPLTVTERRKLEQDEIDRLIAERDELDVLEKYIKARKAAHRTMVFNHLDIELEAVGRPSEADSSGHYVEPGEVVSTGGHRFTREIRSGAPVVTAEALEDLVAEGKVSEEVFSHEDYLACTTQVRVLDEEKTLIHLRRRPEIVEALAVAAIPGKSTASLNRRK
jgi:hypothetical protein